MSDETFRGDAFPGNVFGDVSGNARWTRSEIPGDPWYLPADARTRWNGPVAPVIPAPRASPENRG